MTRWQEIRTHSERKAFGELDGPAALRSGLDGRGRPSPRESWRYARCGATRDVALREFCPSAECLEVEDYARGEATVVLCGAEEASL